MIALEDNFEDVLMKAATGLGLGKVVLAERAGLSVPVVDALLQGELDESALRAVAPVLRLSEEALVAMAFGHWQPEPLAVDGLACLNSPFPVPGYAEMTVNSYLVWSPDTGEAAVFDTGTNAEGLLQKVEALGLELRSLFLTHTHRDHVAAYDALLKNKPQLCCLAPAEEPFRNAGSVAHGDVFICGSLQIAARATPGHSPGGTSFVVRGLARPLAIVGDALFCLSQGGVGQTHYESAMDANRSEILSLPEETILCPGHGPLTTVKSERLRNPFYVQK